MRRNAWLCANMAIMIVLAVTVAENNTNLNNMVEQSMNVNEQALIYNYLQWFNISVCFNTYLECLTKNEFYILPYSVEQTNIVLFCQQKKFINRCMRRSNMRLHFKRCGQIAELVIEKRIEADLFQVEYIVHAHRIYHWLCKFNSDKLPGWNNPVCFAEKFKYCVDHLNPKICLLPCRHYPDAYVHKDMIDVIAYRNRQALMPIWQQALKNSDFLNHTLSIEDCYQLYINCSVTFPYVILPFDVEQSNIQHFCTQQYLIDYCVSVNSVVRLDFHACGYLAEQSKSSSFEAQMMSFAYRTYRYMCEKYQHLIPGWDNPICFMEKFSYCVIDFNATICSRECEPSVAEIRHDFDFNGQTGVTSKRTLPQVFLLCILSAAMYNY
ncbi:hypothetical protein M514_00241 [Trichuris suis]|uniref:FZ domain-containing protein n=1 Tax=Trichuris suis TaxID=68888 RepID=A0A085MPD2_9BILA|nr:hypothetical protein M513_00241 [Trichuris suis]KFD67839.1 hypothetical protein M514_00241 [Trichuris suis]